MPSMSDGTVPEKGLLSRAFGVLTSPRETYADIAARPRVVGALVLTILLSAGVLFAFMQTEVGQAAFVDQQVDALGSRANPQQIAGLERFAPYAGYVIAATIVIFVPIVNAIIAGLALAIFNAMLGGNATFKQNYAVATFSGFVPALSSLVVMPLNYIRETMSSATSLAVFLPMLDPLSFAGTVAGSLDFFRIWWVINLAIGLGVLYKRKTGPIAWGLLVLYAVIALGYAGVRTAFSGA
jgi:hypothetical protein